MITFVSFVVRRSLIISTYFQPIQTNKIVN